MTWPDVAFFVFLVFGVHWASCICGLIIFIKFGKFWASISLNCSLPLSLLGFQLHICLNLCHSLLIASSTALVLVCFGLLSLCDSLWVVFIAVSSSSSVFSSEVISPRVFSFQMHFSSLGVGLESFLSIFFVYSCHDHVFLCLLEHNGVLAILRPCLLILSSVSFLDLFLVLSFSLHYRSYVVPSSFHARTIFCILPSTVPKSDSPTLQSVDPKSVL